MKFQKRTLSMLNESLMKAGFSNTVKPSVKFDSKTNCFELTLTSYSLKVTREVRYAYSETFDDSEDDQEDLQSIILDLFYVWVRRALTD